MSGGNKSFGNFEKIKAQMLESKQRAENIEKPVESAVEESVESTVVKNVDSIVKKDIEKPVKKSVDKNVENSIEKPVKDTQHKAVENYVEENQQADVEQSVEFLIKLPAIKPKVRKKAVNYYMSVDVINAIKKHGADVDMKDSNFLEELLRQVLSIPK